MGNNKPIASPLDDYYQGRGARPSATDLGKGAKDAPEAVIRGLMKQAKHHLKPKPHDQSVNV